MIDPNVAKISGNMLRDAACPKILDIIEGK